MGRVDAARALGKKGDKDAIVALGKAAREDRFWGVQAEAAKALGSIRNNAALDELLASTGVPHPKARRAIVRALGEFRDERAADALAGVLAAGDPSYYVEAAATAAIGKTRSTRAFGALERALEKTTGKVREALGALSGRVKDELERREETGRGRRARLVAHLRPLGKPQERVFTPLYYASLYGPDVLRRLAAALDPRAETHQCIEIL